MRFGKKTPVVSLGNDLPSTSEPANTQTGFAGDSLLGIGAVLSGDIIAQGPVRIDGELIGKVVSRSAISIGVGGIVRGDVDGESAFVAGVIEGNVRVEDSLRILRSAWIRGDITAGLIEMEEGSRLRGTLSIGSSATKTGDMPQRSES